MGYYKRIVVFDVETGGLNPEKNGITEIALVSIDAETLSIVDRYSSLIKPYGDLEYKDDALAMSIKMSLDELEEKGKDSHVVFDEIVDFLANNKVGYKKPILAGHNIDLFDINFLTNFYEFNKRRLDRDVDLSATIDTLKLSRFKYIDSAKHTLGISCKNAGITLVDAHRALEDTEANAKLVVSMLNSLRGEGVATKKEKHRVNFEL